MCGIFSILNSQFDEKDIIQSFEKGINRGPENSTIINPNKNIWLGFHRLAINGLTKKSNQPMIMNDCILICNGEIYNYKNLKKILNFTFETNSDCEIIIHLYKIFGIMQTLQMLDGVFAFLLYDKNKNEIYVARDCYGVRPLFQINNQHDIAFASELKTLIDLKYKSKITIEQFKPGTVSKYLLTNNKWHADFINKFFFSTYIFKNPVINNIEQAMTQIKHSLINAVKKRVNNTDRKIACLLSGGLDSSLITALVNRYVKKGTLETYSIGLKGSEDLFYAKKVASFLGTKHTEIVMSEEDFLKAIPNVIYAIESYDTTTVRASVGNWLVSQYIKKHSSAKVIFNGDGSDEVTGGYLYFHCAPNCYDFDKECKRLLNDIHYFDVLRSDRSISSAGLEARTPFLDRNFVRTYLSIPAEFRCHKTNNKSEKYLLRKTFENMNLLPNDVLFRTKEAFSDGVSAPNKSWYQVIQDYIDNNEETKKIVEQSFEYEINNNKPITNEQIYYRKIFRKFFKNQDNVIPYFWMPRFVEGATDASARTLKIYKKS